MTVSTVTARTAQRQELDAVVKVCMAAFADEAVMAWVIPDSTERQGFFRDMFSTSLDAALAAEAVILAVDADGTPMGASLWLPPATGSEEPETTAAPDDHDLQAQRRAILEAVTRDRVPTVPHLKLDSMATLQEYRGKGAGTAMLTAGLKRASDLGLPVYLEASTSDNRRLYERHGFHDLGEAIDLPYGGPFLQPMWLDA